MRLPKRGIGGWASEIIEACSASRTDRIARGAAFRNLYLTGDENGDPSIYNKSFTYIDTLSSMLYSPVELRFMIEAYGTPTLTDRAKFKAAAAEVHQRMRRSNLDTVIGDAVKWSLVKGKTFIKTLWGAEGLEPYIVQPEMMGVLREDVDTLDRQEAFFHSTYLTRYQFNRLIENHPDAKELAAKAAKYISPGKGQDAPDNEGQNGRQVILGGLYPYQTQGSVPSTQKARGVVDWMSGPKPIFAADVLAKLIRLDELWVWNDDTDDWTTIQIVGPDCVIEGKDRHRNVFADAINTSGKATADQNPLKGSHPFTEFCANRLEGYFWGRSELSNIALLQKNMNVRVTGINQLLRLQEKPPRAITGSASVNQNAYAKFNKPGGFLVDSGPNMKIETLAPQIPAGLYDSLHESEAMMDQMAGLSPVLQGRGEAGVRAGGHAETLIRTSSPRFKDRALLIEREVEELGGLVLNLCKAHVATKIVGWVMPGDDTIETAVQSDPDVLPPPVKSMKPVEFLMAQLPPDAKVMVDSHSASPAFSQETRELQFALAKVGAVNAEYLLQHSDAPGRDSALADLERKQISEAEFAAKHPELAVKAAGKRR